MTPNENLFLNALSPPTRDKLLSRCTPLALPLGTVLYSAQESPQYGYLLTSGMASVVVGTRAGDSAEVGVIGREGLVGAMHLLGPALVPSDCMIQLEAAGLRITMHDLKDAYRDFPEVHERVLELVQEQAMSLSQIAACHRLHEAEPRLARWLLMAQDRTQSEVLHFTQQFLSLMLGSQRSTVTMIAGALQRRGLIEYSRGKVRIVNREGLESAACDCYRVVKELNQNLYKGKHTAEPGNTERSSTGVKTNHRRALEANA